MNSRLSASLAALLAVALLAGCAKTDEAASTGANTSAGDAVAEPESENATEVSDTAEVIADEDEPVVQ